MNLSKLKLLLNVKELRRQGLLAQYYRFVIRPKIFKTKPCVCPPDAAIEVQAQICRRDWINAIWTFKCFRYYSGQPFRLVMHLDHTNNPLRQHEIETLAEHFPGAIIPSRSQIAELVNERFLPHYPTLARMHREGKFFTLPKVVDSFLMSERKVWIHLDPDVLFFDHPRELLEPFLGQVADRACFNCNATKVTADGVYCVNPQEIKARYGLELTGQFQIGLGWTFGSILDWTFLEKVASEVHIDSDRAFMMDQTLWGLACAKSGWLQLPPGRYAVQPIQSLSGVVARHYYSKTRHLMYKEGMSRLYRNNFLLLYDQL